MLLPWLAHLCLACADIVAGHSLFVAKFLGFITEEKHTKTLAYLDKVMQRPAFQKVFLPPKEA